MNQKLVPWIYASCLFVAFPWALDKSTFPKTFALVFVTILLLFIRQLGNFSHSLSILLVMWSVLLFTLLVRNEFENLNSILLGYPQRNIGLLSILLFLIVFFYFISMDLFYRLKTLSISAFFISLSIWTSYLTFGLHRSYKQEDEPRVFIFLTQFTFPLPDAINRNVVSFFLCLGLITSIQMLTSHYSNLISRRTQLFISFTIFSTILLLGDLQTLVYLGVLGLFQGLALIKFSAKNASNLLFITITLLPLLNLFTLSSSQLTNNPSLDERLNINRSAFLIAKDMPFAFSPPDTTADTKLSAFLEESIPGHLVDNAHSVWLELALHLGWVPTLLLMFVFISILFITLIGIVINLQAAKFTTKVAAIKFAIAVITFASSFITILHPITIFALAVVASTLFADFHVSFSRLINETVIFSRFRVLIGGFLSPRAKKKPLRILSRYKRIGMALLLIPIISLVLIIKQHIEFHVLESKLLTNSASFDNSVIKLTDLALEMNDREYLEYVGRQLTSLNNCSQLLRVLREQKKLGFSDKRAQNLTDWYSVNCGK